MTNIDYYPAINSGQSIYESEKIDRRRMYGPAKYNIRSIYLLPKFKLGNKVVEIDTEYILFETDKRLVYDIITSLN